MARWKKQAGDQPKTDREDAKDPEKGKGKKCGNSFIPKNFECAKKQGLQTAAKVALVAGGATAAFVGGRHASRYHLGILSPRNTNPNSGGFNRPRAWYAASKGAKTSTTDIADSFAGYKGRAGVDDAILDRHANFIKKYNVNASPTGIDDIKKSFIKNHPEHAAQADSIFAQFQIMRDFGALDGAAGPYTNTIFVRATRKNINGSLKVDHSAVLSDLDESLGLVAEGKNPSIFASRTKSGDVNEHLVILHESAHVLHYKGSLKIAGTTKIEKMHRVNEVEVGGRKVKGEELRKALFDASSQYGSSDIDGERCETFAELYSLYVLRPKAFKAQHPVAYSWVDTMTNQLHASLGS